MPRKCPRLPFAFAYVVFLVVARAAPPPLPRTSVRAAPAMFAGGGAGLVEQCPAGSFSTEIDSIYECMECIIEKIACPAECCSVTFHEGSNQALYCRLGGCCIRYLTVEKTELYAAEALTATGKEGGGTTCTEIEKKDNCPACAYALVAGVDVKCNDKGYDLPARRDHYNGGSLCAGGGILAGTGEMAKTNDKHDGGGGPSVESVGEESNVGEATPGPAADEKKPKTKPVAADKQGANSARSDEKVQTKGEEIIDVTETESAKPVGAIIGGSVGGVTALIAICGLFLYCCRRKERRDGEKIPFPSLGTRHVTASAMAPIPTLPTTPSLPSIMPPEPKEPESVQADGARPSDAQKSVEGADTPDEPLSANGATGVVRDREPTIVDPPGGGIIPLLPAPTAASSKARKSPLDRPMLRTPPQTPPESPSPSNEEPKRFDAFDGDDAELTPHPSELSLNPATPEQRSRQTAFAGEFGELDGEDLML